MPEEYTVEQRAGIATRAMPKPLLSAKQKREVDELLYTLSEAGMLPRLDAEQAALLWSAVQLVKDGGFTQDMRL